MGIAIAAREQTAQEVLRVLAGVAALAAVASARYVGLPGLDPVPELVGHDNYALRRRFYFYQLLPVVDGKASVLERWLGKQHIAPEVQTRILRLFVDLNQHVQEKLGEHFQVGHSYFMNSTIETEAGLRSTWQDAILPLLDEYFYNHRNRGAIMQEFDLDQLLSEQVTPQSPSEE